MVAHDVVTWPRGFKFLYKLCLKAVRVAQMELPASWKGHCKIEFLCKPKQDVHDSAAGCFVGLQEHDISSGVTGFLVKGEALPHSG